MTDRFADARYALGVVNQTPVIVWQASHGAWLLPRHDTLVVAEERPRPLDDAATDVTVAEYLARGGTTLVLGDPLDALAALPPATWTIELVAAVITVRAPDGHIAFIAQNDTRDGAAWIGAARQVGTVAFFAGRSLIHPTHDNIDLATAARAGTLVAGSATITTPTHPATCPLCLAPVNRTNDEGIWQLFVCTTCPWSTAILSPTT